MLLCKLYRDQSYVCVRFRAIYFGRTIEWLCVLWLNFNEFVSECVTEYGSGWVIDCAFGWLNGGAKEGIERIDLREQQSHVNLYARLFGYSLQAGMEPVLKGKILEKYFWWIDVTSLEWEWYFSSLRQCSRDQMAGHFQTTFSNSIKFHWSLLPRVLSKYSSTDSDNGLAPSRLQDVIWTNDG